MESVDFDDAGFSEYGNMVWANVVTHGENGGTLGMVP